MESTEDTGGSKARLEVYVRGYEPGAYDRQDEVIDRLRELEDAGAISGFDVYEWDRRVRPASPGGEGSGGGGPNGAPRAVDKVTEFEQWAEREGTSLRPFFDRRVVGASFLDEEQEVIVLPVICLAAYRDDDLKGVVPCTEGDRNCSVDEFLSRLEAETTADRRVASETD